MLHTMNSTLAGVLLLRAAGMGVGKACAYFLWPAAAPAGRRDDEGAGCFMPGVQAAVANPQLYSQLLRNASC
jgi:hypothetical protein